MTQIIGGIKVLALVSILFIFFSPTLHAKSFGERPVYGIRENPNQGFNETIGQVGFIYGLTWIMFPLFQPSTFLDDGSTGRYRDNFGRLVWDKDEPFWNWMVHPYSGSQLYLYYRANGHTPWSAIGLSFISQALFEFTVEIYTEPASYQDNYITTVWGAILGHALENFSLKLLNGPSQVSRLFGHLLNPSSLLWFYSGKVHFMPILDHRPGQEKLAGQLILEF